MKDVIYNTRFLVAVALAATADCAYGVYTVFHHASRKVAKR